MAYGINGTAKWEAVHEACDKLGVRTSIDTLQAAAQEIYGGKIGRQTIYIERIKYRATKKTKIDCRTYNGQPRRNMLNDTFFTQSQLHRLVAFIGKGRSRPSDLLRLIAPKDPTAFHSIEHLTNAVEYVRENRLKLAA